MPNPCIIITFHTKQPNAFEVISLQQCGKVLRNYPIYLVHPESIPGDNYFRFFPESLVFDMPLADRWFSSYQNFQRLKVSYWFFRRFQTYSHLLFYEPDCFVFEDKLLDWCSQPFDYIGAPWICKQAAEREQLKITGVGNGGFSIRNIPSTLRALSSRKRVFSLEHFKRKHIRFGRRHRPLQWLTVAWKWSIPNRYRYIHSIFDWIEDPFMCTHIPKAFPFFKIAEPSKAIQFSFEVAPRLLYAANNDTLPFGCHAWWSYDLDFWKPHIEAHGFTVDATEVPELTTSARPIGTAAIINIDSHSANPDRTY